MYMYLYIYICANSKRIVSEVERELKDEGNVGRRENLGWKYRFHVLNAKS